MRYLLYGTGIYGPTGEPIRPVTAKALAWPNTGAISLLTGSMGRRAAGPKSKGTKGRQGDMVFANSVKGTIWQDKKDEVVAALISGFKSGVADYKEGDEEATA